jgi:hypothetical protein
MTMAQKQGRQPNERINAFCRAAGVESCWSAVRVHAEQILADYEKTAPPFDAWELCRLRGIRVQTARLRGCDARLLPIPGGYIAEVHSGHRRERQSFSLCHELGHTLFYNGSIENSECDVSASSREAKLEERLCDSIASELLMPRKVFTEEVAKREPSWGALTDVAGTFQVSIEAAINRICDLDIWRCILMVVRPSTTTGGQETFTEERIKPCRSLGRNPIGTWILVQKILEFLASEEGGQVFRTRSTYKVDLGLSAQLSLAGQYFRVNGHRLARLLVVNSSPQLPLKESSCTANSMQLPLFVGQLEA